MPQARQGRAEARLGGGTGRIHSVRPHVVTSFGPRAALLAVTLSAVGAAAESIPITVSSTTLFAGRPEWRDGQTHTATPIIERVGLWTGAFDATYVQDLRVTVLAWGLADPSVASGERAVAGDVDLAYVEGTLLKRRVTLRLGRQSVIGGAVRAMSLDGLSSEVRIWRGLGVSGFGGVPVLPRFAVGRGDALAGTRVFWRQSIDTEIGASFVHLQDRGLAGRQDLGIDARYVPHRDWFLNGSAIWSLLEHRLAEGEIGARWQPRLSLQLLATYRRTAPDLFISRASIFSVFAEERRDEAGGGAFWKPLHWLGLYADYRMLWLEQGTGSDAALRATANVGVSTVGAQARFFREPVNSYWQARVWGVQPLSRVFSVSGDLDAYWFEHSINAVPRSFSLSASANYAFAPGWRAVLSGIAGDTPFFSRRFEVLARIAFDFTTHSRGAGR